MTGTEQQEIIALLYEGREYAKQLYGRHLDNLCRTEEPEYEQAFLKIGAYIDKITGKLEELNSINSGTEKIK